MSENHEAHIRRLLDEVAAGNGRSQRSLATNVGVALGLTNLLLKRVVRQGWVRVSRVKRNRVRYLITPTGIAEKARMTRKYLSYSVGYYIEVRHRIRERLAALSAELSRDGAETNRIVFWGDGEIIEIGYLCVPETDLCLVALVDDHRTRPFFDVPVHPVSALSAHAVAGTPFERIVIMSLDRTDAILTSLEARGIAPERVFWL